MVQIISNVSPMSNSGSSMPVKPSSHPPPHGQQVHAASLSQKESSVSQSSSLPASDHPVRGPGPIADYHNRSLHQPDSMQRTQYPGQMPQQPQMPLQNQMPPRQSQMPLGPPMPSQTPPGPFNNMAMSEQKNLGNNNSPMMQQQYMQPPPQMGGQNVNPGVKPPMVGNQQFPPQPGAQMMGPPMGAQPPQAAMAQPRPPMPGVQSNSAPQNNFPPMPPQNNLSGPPQNSMKPPMPETQNTMPPQSMSQNMPPQSMSQNMPPQNMSQNMPPQNMAQSMPPQNMSQNMPPQSMPQSMPPQNMSQNMPPQNMSQNMPPQNNMGSKPPMPSQMNSMPGYQMPQKVNALQNHMAGMTLSGPPLDQQNNQPPAQNTMYSNLSGPPLPGQQQNVQDPMSGYKSPAGMPPRPMPNQHNLQPHLPPTQNASYMQGQRPPPLAGQAGQYPPEQSPMMQQPGMPPYNQGYPQQKQMYPSQPNIYNQRGGYPEGPGGYQPGMGNVPPAKKQLDPDQMPSPIQVIHDDRNLRGGEFLTNQKGLVPPLVTTNFVVHDQGNASPRYIRSTIYTVPTTADILKQSHVPFALILSPMARAEPGEYEPMIVNMGEIGPVRCVRCKAYMCPYMQFVDAGKRFQCMFCKVATEVPPEYFQHLDHTGQRMDRHERPELMLGTYEYIATKDYCRNNTFPKPPAIVFVIDVSYNNVKSGLVNLICAKMKEIIRNLPVDVGQEKSNMKVGFITYDNTVHFYNIKQCLAQPQMMVVGDVQDVFMPLLDGFLCDPEESEVVIDSLMAQIPTMFAETNERDTILAPAIQAGLEAMKASECVGKLMVFHSSLPTADAPGKLKKRDEVKLLGTDKEKNVLAPQNNTYNNLGQDCVSAGVSVDLFVFNYAYVDIPTISQVCRLTGGQVYKYTYFQADTDGERFITDLINNIKRPVAFDSVMRIRTSTGVRATDFYGHFFMSNTTDMDIPSIDCDKAVAVEVKHDDKLAEEEGVFIQVALLYTSCGGVRRLRIINQSLGTSADLANLYRSCELDAIMNFFAKQSVFKLSDSTPKQVKDNLISRCANMLAAYRKNCASSPSGSGQLILPECMKLLPLYINCLLKSDALSGGPDMTIDDRAFMMQAACFMTVKASVRFIYPRLIALHNVDPQTSDFPQMRRCSIDKFTEDGAYLLENGIHMFLWLGASLSSQWVQSVFGCSSVAHIQTPPTSIPILENPLNKRIRDIISQIRAEHVYCMRLTILKQRDKLEVVMRHFLVEDPGHDKSLSYVDFLCHMHKEIRQIVS